MQLILLALLAVQSTVVYGGSPVGSGYAKARQQVGDIFIVAGQSNALGQGTTLNSSVMSALMFRRDKPDWVLLADPTDRGLSGPTPSAGSVWPAIGTAYVSLLNLPVGFVTTAEDGSVISSWLPGQSLYTRMLAQYALATKLTNGNLRGVLWWQGESDALNGVSQSSYHSSLATLAGGIRTDLGVKLFVAKLQNCSGVAPASNLTAINAAIAQAWTDVPNVAPGPDLSDLPTDDGFHLKTDAHIATAAARWWTAIRSELGW